MTRPTTEGCMSIDIRAWHRDGLLRAGQCFAYPLTWMWKPTEGVGVLTKADAVVLMFRSRSCRGEYGRTITQRVVLTLRKTLSVSVTRITLFWLNSIY